MLRFGHSAHLSERHSSFWEERSNETLEDLSPRQPSATEIRLTPRCPSLAAAFTNVVTSFVSDILLPPLSVILPLNANLDLKFAVLQAGDHYREWGGYNTIDQAQDDGAVVMAYGVFLNKTINFVGLGMALYGLASLYQYFTRDPIIKRTVKCRYCKKRINEKVRSLSGRVCRCNLMWDAANIDGHRASDV